MLKESKNKIIAVFQQNIDALKKEIKGIDERYKKLAEEEKKELKEMLEYWKAQRNALNDGKNLVVVPAVEEQTETPVADIPDEEEEKVVDSIFPENNESDEMEDEQEEAVDESVSEENSELSDVWPEETAAEEEEEKDEPADDNDGWPEFPEEWK